MPFPPVRTIITNKNNRPWLWSRHCTEHPHLVSLPSPRLTAGETGLQELYGLSKITQPGVAELGLPLQPESVTQPYGPTGEERGTLTPSWAHKARQSVLVSQGPTCGWTGGGADGGVSPAALTVPTAGAQEVAVSPAEASKAFPVAARSALPSTRGSASLKGYSLAPWVTSPFLHPRACFPRLWGSPSR